MAIVERMTVGSILPTKRGEMQLGQARRGLQIRVRGEHRIDVVQQLENERFAIERLEVQGSPVEHEHRHVQEDTWPEASADGQVDPVAPPAALPFAIVQVDRHGRMPALRVPAAAPARAHEQMALSAWHIDRLAVGANDEISAWAGRRGSREVALPVYCELASGSGMPDCCESDAPLPFGSKDYGSKWKQVIGLAVVLGLLTVAAQRRHFTGLPLALHREYAVVQVEDPLSVSDRPARVGSSRLDGLSGAGPSGRRTSSAASAPMTIVEGARTPASPIVASVARTTSCRSVVAQRTAATGVSAARPAATNRAAMSAMFSAPINTTMVPRVAAIAPQLTDCLASDDAWPVTTVTACTSPRNVSGMPAAIGAASDEETPGTISKDTPASANASASSPPRANTNGSPPFSRTTHSPARPRSTSIALMSACGTGAEPRALPTSMRSACAGAMSSNDPPINRS